jgi:Phage integrase, N-terminal SAM-like domain
MPGFVVITPVLLGVRERPRGHVLRDWMVFCAGHGTGVFAGREDLKAVLGAYAAYRAEGPEQARFAATTWNRHVSVLSSFYQWAVAEGYAAAVPFSYAQAQVRYGDVRRDAQVNLARRRVPQRHVTIRYRRWRRGTAVPGTAG